MNKEIYDSVKSKNFIRGLEIINNDSITTRKGHTYGSGARISLLHFYYLNQKRQTRREKF